MTDEFKKLTAKQELFVQHYIMTDCMAEAVRLAGYTTKYPDRWGWELINKKPYIGAEIRRRQEARRAAEPDMVKRIEAAIAEIAFAEIGKNGIRNSDKLKALELLGKSRAMFVDRNEITGKNGAPLTTTISADTTPEEASEAYSNLLN